MNVIPISIKCINTKNLLIKMNEKSYNGKAFEKRFSIAAALSKK